MARILVGGYMFRYPLGGMLSFSLQWLAGFHRLGHEVYLVEKSGWPGSCFDPVQNQMSDDCSSGIEIVSRLLARFGLSERWSYVDVEGRHHGLDRSAVNGLFESADLFVDLGSHGSWAEEASRCGCRALVDGEPGFRQMKMESSLAAGEPLPEYDFYFSVGRNIGTPSSPAPTAGKQWRAVFHPVMIDLFEPQAVSPEAAFTTVMNWQSYEPLHYQGQVFGHKDIEFEKFMTLPAKTTAAMEVAVSGRAPLSRLRDSGWRIRDAHEVTTTVDSFWNYLAGSKGEFSVCKSGFVKTNSGWFSDRAAAYLACGRPVVQQDTGFGSQLPCGEGLMAVRTVEEAADAIEEICGNYAHHAKRAREVAVEYLNADKVLGEMIDVIGV